MRVVVRLDRHTFCYICIENWARINKTCPLCKQSIRRRKLEKDLIALNIIDDLPSRCIHPECSWTGIYSAVKKHQRECEHRPKKSLENNLDQRIEVVELCHEESSSQVEIICLSEAEEEHSYSSQHPLFPLSISPD